MSLLRKALEGDLETPPTTVAEPATPTPNDGNQPNNEQSSVVMSGPLGQVYTQALAIAFAKPAPEAAVEGDIQQTVTEVALESQANDAIMAASAINAVTGAEADALEDPEALIYGVSAQHLDEATVTDVATQMSQFELDQPEEFIVVIDATDMAQDVVAGVDQSEHVQNAEEYLTQPVNDANLEKSELIPVLESMVVAMGGRVVYSLRQALECIEELRSEEPKVIEIDMPAGDPIAEAGESVSEPAAEVKDAELAAPTEVKAPAEEKVDGVVEEKPAVEKVKEVAGPDSIAEAGSQETAPDTPIALESAKGGKKPAKKDDKKKEDPASKLNRAKNLINGQMSKIKDSAVRAELHHAVGIILSAQRDISGKKALEALALEGKSGWMILLEAIGEALDPTTVRNVLNGLSKTKTSLEDLEGQVRRGAASDEKIISTCTTGVTAIKRGVDLIEEQQKQLKNAKTQVSKLV